MNTQLISQEDFASVQQVQAGITRLFKKAKDKKRFIRVMRNQEPLGVLIPNDMWLNLIEDLEALSNTKYIQEIQESRQDKKRYTSNQVKKIIGYKKT
ncbi:hypothetical protein A2W14_06100 [Candidatus Gottesmanbacteria bacterium RBG_16_37_8]|uniref:Antitoxin n=1 Tax=Candidatus Gottesmanbacteria bacterium RBG_16_37_8 TaxID=1798371 RepID=A0A1F5YRD3_9BACT|nr:MAG: hypothetical protein A2W14_06100 [Candidatus Gottesmanbacteria bacterium RBG_16_37_8]